MVETVVEKRPPAAYTDLRYTTLLLLTSCVALYA